jgi:hypothetical protein
MALKVEPRVRSVKKLPRWLLSCIRPPWTLGHASSMAGSTRARAHRRRAEVGGGRWGGGRNPCPMIMQTGQKERTREGSKSSKGIEEWIGSVMASRRRRNSWAHLSGEEETAKGRYFPLASILIAGGEREGAVPVPHVGDSRPMARRSGRIEACVGALISVGDG